VILPDHSQITPAPLLDHFPPGSPPDHSRITLGSLPPVSKEPKLVAISKIFVFFGFFGFFDIIISKKPKRLVFLI